MPLLAPYAPGHPLDKAVRQEIARRLREDELAPGAAQLEGLFLRFEGLSVLGARPWGPEGGAWLLYLRRSPRWSRWRSVEPWLDLRGLNLAAPRPHAEPRPPRPLRSLDRRGSYRQLRLAFPGDELARAWNERARALPDALLPVPDWAIDQAARLPPDCQWRILQFLNATREPGRDLCHSNLPLAFLLASQEEERAVPVAEAVSWKQRRILGALGFPEQQTAVRVLRRVDDRVLSSALLGQLQAWMSDSACLRRLAHVPRLGAAGIALRSARELAWFDDRALPEVLGSNDPELLRDLQVFAPLARRLRQLGYGPQSPISSPGQIRERSAAMRRQLREVGDLPADGALPDPPIPGIPGAIEPLRTVHDVHLEGKRMRHCVRTYVRHVLKGRVALYRVLQPQRATLSLVRKGRRWRLDQLSLFANAKPSWQCFAVVDRWLRTHTPPAPRPRSAQRILFPE
jgi:hypothetical protein